MAMFSKKYKVNITYNLIIPIIQKFIADALTGELDNVVNIEDIEEE